MAIRHLSSRRRLRRALLGALLLTALLAAGMGTAQRASAAFPGANGKIVFTTADGIETINPDGSGRKVVGGTDGDREPAYSPDGSRIAFTNNNDELMVMSAYGGKATKIADEAFTPSWSADGTKIAFGSYGGIAIVNADGTGLTPTVTHGQDMDPAWSPDGTQIVFSRWDPGTSTYALWSVPATGGTETGLTPTGVDAERASWSPDGTKIAFQGGASDLQVVVINADGSGATAITSSGQNSNPVWSPNGKKIAFTSSRSRGLWMMSADGSNQTHVAGTPTMSVFDWQPSRVTATASKGRITYGKSVTITVHLGTVAVTENHTVTLKATPKGGTTKTIGSKTVNGRGDASFAVSPKRTTTFAAVWSGDAAYLGGGVGQTTVKVRARVKITMSGFYAKSGHNHLYHYTSSCTASASHCPTLTVTVSPNKAGQRILFYLQMRRSGHWRTVYDFHARLGSRSRITEILIYGSSGVIGIPTRVHAIFQGDDQNARATSKWAYFEVTH